MANNIEGELRVTGNITRGGTLRPDVPRSNLQQDALSIFPVALTDLRVWDAIQTSLPGTPASDDLGIAGGTWGTHAGKITTGDVKAGGTVTRRAYFTVAIPPEYDEGETVAIRVAAGMETTVAGTSATVDLEAYVNGRDGTIDGSDVVQTAAQSMNSLTFANKDFVLDPSALSRGDVLEVRLTIVTMDGATGTAVIASIGAIELLADIRG